MSGVGAGSPRGRVRLLGGRLVRWMYKSGHREMLTRELEPTVAALRGVVLDVGGGRDSPLAGAWTDAARRVRIDVVLAERPIIQADACRLPVRSGSVDAVLISEVLEHVADPEAAFTEIHRVLRPGGELAGSVPFRSCARGCTLIPMTSIATPTPPWPDSLRSSRMSTFVHTATASAWPGGWCSPAGDSCSR